MWSCCRPDADAIDVAFADPRDAIAEYVDVDVNVYNSGHDDAICDAIDYHVVYSLMSLLVSNAVRLLLKMVGFTTRAIQQTTFDTLSTIMM